MCGCRLNKGWLGEGFSLLLEEEACGLCGQVSARGDGVTSQPVLKECPEYSVMILEYWRMKEMDRLFWIAYTDTQILHRDSDVVYSLLQTANFKIHLQYTLCAVIACYFTFSCKALKHWYLFNMSGLFWWSCTAVTMHNFLLSFGWCGFKLIRTSSTVPRHCHATFPSALMRNQDTAASCHEGCTSFPQLPSLAILLFLLFLPSFQTDTVLLHLYIRIHNSFVGSLALQMGTICIHLFSSISIHHSTVCAVHAFCYVHMNMYAHVKHSQMTLRHTFEILVIRSVKQKFLTFRVKL